MLFWCLWIICFISNSFTVYFHAFSGCFVSLVSLEKSRKFARRKKEICQNVKYTPDFGKSVMIKKCIPIQSLWTALQYRIRDVRGSNIGKRYTVILHCWINLEDSRFDWMPVKSNWVLLKGISRTMQSPGSHCGFINGKFCLINLIPFYNKVACLVDEGKVVAVAFLDFSNL